MALSGFEDYMVDPKYAAVPGPAGIPLGMDPLGGVLADFLGLGGKEKKKDKWVQQADGSWRWTGGGLADVPDTDIPTVGAPDKSYRQAANQVRILDDLYPYYAKAMAGQIIPQEQAKLEAAKVTSPQMAELMTSLYKQYGPQLNEIGNEIARTNALASASRDKDVLQGPGKELIAEALQAMKLADPEFFATREKTSGRLSDLLSSIDLTGGLSETERREVEQGLAREGSKAGTEGAPSQTETVARGMTYGDKGRKRVTENQTALTNAIMASSNFLPASRSGIDPFQVATGKSSTNTGENKFTGINKPGNEAYELGQGLFGGIGSHQAQQAQIGATAKLNEKDWLDQFQQFTSGLGNLGSLAGGMAMCWLAREVYGINNIKWVKFKHYLIFDAPTWLFKLYLNYGSMTAKLVKHTRILKPLIRKWMNSKIKGGQ